MNKFDLQWISYYEPDRKIWGWFTKSDPLDDSETVKRQWGLKNCYCFWAVCGKTISMNKHLIFPRNMERLQEKKLSNKYQKITEQDLLAMWPSFYDDLHNRFIFASLKEQI